MTCSHVLGALVVAAVVGALAVGGVVALVGLGAARRGPGRRGRGSQLVVAVVIVGPVTSLGRSSLLRVRELDPLRHRVLERLVDRRTTHGAADPCLT